MKKLSTHGHGFLMAAALVWLVGQQGVRPLSADQAGGLPSLERRVAALEAKVDALQKVNTGQAEEITALKLRVTQTESKLAFVSVQGTDMVITGANLHLRNGLGATNGNPAAPFATDPTMTQVNATGNLVIGYNDGSALRTGSHNLVMGGLSSYDSFGGIVAGLGNSALSPYASVLGGRGNRAIGNFSTIVGGAFNVTTIDGHTASILGGDGNEASELDVTIAGGNLNTVTARFASIGGGANLTVDTEYGWAAGFPGFGPQFSGWFSSP